MKVTKIKKMTNMVGDREFNFYKATIIYKLDGRYNGLGGKFFTIEEAKKFIEKMYKENLLGYTKNCIVWVDGAFGLSDYSTEDRYEPVNEKWYTYQYSTRRHEWYETIQKANI